MSVNRTWYHGTSTYFEKFSNVYTGGQLGIHLGSYDQALWRLGDEKGYIIKVKATFSKLLLLKDQGNWYGHEFIEQLKSIKSLNHIKWYSSMSDSMIVSILKNNNYDGVIYKNMFEGEKHEPSIIIFDANNIEIIDRVDIN